MPEGPTGQRCISVTITDTGSLLGEAGLPLRVIAPEAERAAGMPGGDPRDRRSAGSPS